MEICNECGKKLRPLALKLHMVTEHGTQQVPCPKCGKLFKHPSALPRHFKRAHDECQCEECGKVCIHFIIVYIDNQILITNDISVLFS